MNRPVAIVGIGCRFPGGVHDVDSFWSLLREGKSAISEIPRDRMDVDRWFDARPKTPGRIASRWGGFLDQLDQFDPAFFGISPREAERMDPQQRLLLETAWEALEDAGQDARKLDGSRTGVFVGQWVSDFEGRLFADPEVVDFYMTTGSGRYASSGRISYALGLRGPSLTIDTACSSSLAAVHLAARSVRSGECELALAGGANVILQPHVTIAYSQSGMMAPDGRCKFGDAAGDGYVRSEGAAVIALKPLDRALADGDRVYAVIRGSAVNNDGKSSGSMGTPSREGQEDLLRSAYRDAGVPAGLVGYVEAHGTGTRSGDPVELGALGAVLAEGRAPGLRAWVGSVKTNLGHTEGAAGVAGLIKVALALHRGAIPPSLNFNEPTPAVAWAEAPFAIPTAEVPWPRGEGRRIGGSSAFGIAGTNAHVVLEEAPAADAPEAAAVGRVEKAARATALLPLSAASPQALRELAGRYADLLDRDGAELADVCRSAATRRAQLDHRAAFVARDRGGMAVALRQFVAGDPAAAQGVVPGGARPKIAFVLPGQGAQWHGMARQLLAEEPVFREALERCDRAAKATVSWSILEQLQSEPGAPGYRLDQIDVIQPVLVALAIAYAALLRDLGVTPDALVGHSMGEVGAAHLAGALDLTEAMRIVCRRSLLMHELRGQGAMALVDLSKEAAAARIVGREDRIGVAVSNSPRASVVSGDPAAVQELLAELQREGIFCRLVKVDVASHSPQMAPVAAGLSRELAGLSPRPTTTPFYSTVLGRRAEGAELDGGYWARNVRQPVLFTDAVRALIADGVTVFVELGPHPVLLPSVAQTAEAAGRAVTTIDCGRRDEPQQAAMLSAAGAVWSAGAVDSLQAAVPAGRNVSLPLYPWQRERHWVDAAVLRRGKGSDRAAEVKPDPESLGWLHRLAWRPSEPAAARPTAGWVVFAADEDSAALVAAELRRAGATAEAAPLHRLEAVLATRAAAADQKLHGIAVLADEGPDTAHLPLRVLQAALASPWRSAPRLWFVTRGAQQVDGHPSARLAIEQAALWGAARVVGEEHPDLWGGLVDLDPSGDPALLARHLLSGDGEDQSALRAGQRFVLRLEPVKKEGPFERFAWRNDSSYLVTGGLGGVGLHVAHAMAAAGARRLVLLGRTPLPPRESWAACDPNTPAGQRVTAVRALEALGASVQIASVDLGDESELRAFLERHAAEGWPPIRGVVHAAAALDNGLAASQDRRAFDAALRPKLRGAQLLDRLLPDLDLFVVFSSVLSFFAQPGSANYAAANAGLEALAHDRRARGLPAISIAWGVWTDTGLVRGEGGGKVAASFGQQGLQGFSPERGVKLFDALCGQDDAAVAVLPVDWAAFRRAKGARLQPLYRDVVAAQASASEPAAGARIADASPAEQRKLLEAVVREAVGAVLKIAPARLDPRKALGALGLGSLLAMELRNRLEAALSRPLSATLAFNHPTVEALVEHLAGAPPAAAAAPTAEISPAAVETSEAAARRAASLQQISDLSDEEAALALGAGRPRGTT